VHIGRLGKDGQVHDTTGRPRRVGIRNTGQVAHDGRKEIGGFGKGITPHGVVTVRLVLDRPLFEKIAIGQEGGVVRGTRRQSDTRKGRHVVGTVGKVGDAPKALGFALRTIHAARLVKARELRILFWHDVDRRGQGIAIRERHEELELARPQDIVRPLHEGLVVQGNRLETHTAFVAVQNDGRLRIRTSLVLVPRQDGLYDGVSRTNVKVQSDVGDTPGQRGVGRALDFHRRRRRDVVRRRRLEADRRGHAAASVARSTTAASSPPGDGLVTSTA
jgi:hypothetical protein